MNCCELLNLWSINCEKIDKFGGSFRISNILQSRCVQKLGLFFTIKYQQHNLSEIFFNTAIMKFEMNDELEINLNNSATSA